LLDVVQASSLGSLLPVQFFTVSYFVAPSNFGGLLVFEDCGFPNPKIQRLKIVFGHCWPLTPTTPTKFVFSGGGFPAPNIQGLKSCLASFGA
jgi:hypothetical protein